MKYCPGGLLDIEFSVQIAAITKKLKPEHCQTLELINLLSENSKDWKEAAEQLKKNYQNLRKHEQLFQLVAARSGSLLSPKNKDTLRLGKLLKMDCIKLIAHLKNTCNENESILKKLDPIWSSS